VFGDTAEGKSATAPHNVLAPNAWTSSAIQTAITFRLAMWSTVALFCMHYNFGRMHQNLKATPAMAAGLSSHVWSIQEIVSLSAQERLIAAA
jgi:hypothetical protein